MKFQYVCKDVKLSKAMKEAGQSKLQKIERYFKNADGVVVNIRINVRPDKTICVEASFTAKGYQFRAKAVDEDYYNALDKLIDRLEGQLRKMKTQMERNNKQRALAKEMLLDQFEQNATEYNVKIVRKKNLSLAPMDVDEALTRMDALGHSFFIYLDSATGLINVLYEREEGGYGLIAIDK